jgi:hypothetical protein
MDKMLTRFAAERMDEAGLQSRFADLQAILYRAEANRAWALAALETVEGERNRRMARRVAPAPWP